MKDPTSSPACSANWFTVTPAVCRHRIRWRTWRHFSSDAADPEDTATVLSHGPLNLLSPKPAPDSFEHLGAEGLPGELKQAARENTRECPGPLPLRAIPGQRLRRGYSPAVHEIEILRETKLSRPRPASHGRLCPVVRRSAGIKYLASLSRPPRPSGALEALKAPPPILGLTSELQSLSSADLQEALANLRDARLLAPADPDRPDTLDCHPLIREYFERLKAENPEAWRNGPRPIRVL